MKKRLLRVRCNLLIALLVFMAVAPVQAQDVSTVAGTIKDKNGEPIQGASVMVVGTTTGTTADVNGAFTISAKRGQTLEISSVGFKSVKVTVFAAVMPVVLSEEAGGTLDEVVIIGYGEQKRKNLTSAQTTVSAKDIGRTVNTTFDQALQGRAAGVMVTTNSAQPGGGISVNIRGLGSIGGTTEPLYVIDGIQIQPALPGYNNQSSLNPLAELNPSDIESMEVLQGPSATAIYGSRATNGVVLVTTKRGKAGNARITYDVLYTLQGIPPKLPVLNLPEFVEINTWIRENYTGEQIPVHWQDPSLLAEGTDWQSEIFKRAPFVKHQLSVQGGTEKTRFYLSGERFDQEGVVMGSGFDRTSVRLNLDNNTRSWLKLSSNLSASQTNDNVGTTVTQGIRNAFTMPSYIAPRNPDGSWGGYSADEATYRKEDLNPLAMAELRTVTEKRNALNGGVTATVFLFEGLQFRTNLNVGINHSNSTDFMPTWQLGSVSNSQAKLSKRSTESSYWNWNQLLEYNKKLFTHHNINVMVSHEAQESRYEGLTGARTGFPVNELPGGELPAISLGDALGATNGGYRGWWAQESYLGRVIYNFKDRYIANFTYRGDGSVNFGENNRWGFFPSFSAAWRISDEPFFKNNIKAINDLKFRYETGLTGNQGSGGVYAPLRPVASPWGNGFMVNRYKNPDLKWEETMTQNFGFNLSLFNSRVNIEGDIYTRKTDNLIMENKLALYMGTEGAGAILSPYVNVGALKNKGWAFTLNTVNISRPGLRWATNFNISHNKATILKFYQETAVVDMTNRNTNWNTSGDAQIFRQRSAVGQVPWQFYGWLYDGIFKTKEEVDNSAVPVDGNGNRLPTNPKTGVWVGDYKYVDLNGDGKITTEDQTYIGNPYPKVTFGLTNDVTWKGFNLSLLLTGSYGNKVFNAFRYQYSQVNRVYSYQNALKEALNFAHIGTDELGDPYLENPDATVARYGGLNGNATRATDRYVEDGSYVRVKNLTLSYQVPGKLFGQVRFLQGARLSVGVQNLYTFTNYKGYDPEVGYDTGAGSDVNRRTFGVDIGQYPQVRSYTFSLGIDF